MALILLGAELESFSEVYHVSLKGNNLTGVGSSGKPWRTLTFALLNVTPHMGNIIHVEAGIYVEQGPLEIPPGVSIEGAGIDQTYLKANDTFFYHPENPGYALDKFLIRLSGSGASAGNQYIKDLTIDGDSKQLHGGIFVGDRSHIVIERVKIQFTNFSAIWLSDVNDSRIKDIYLLNCSWGSNGYSSGAINLANLVNVELDGLDINEDTGYGIKALDLKGFNSLSRVQIYNCHISVSPTGLWNNGQAPNMAIELWNVQLAQCEIYNCYVDNTISLVIGDSVYTSGTQAMRIHHNVFDMETRAHGAGYGIELSIHDAEVDHNYFYKGTYGIANWGNPVKNWLIHHNVFYALQAQHPGDVVRAQQGGLRHVSIYNNTVEFTGDKTMNFIGLYGGHSSDLDILNNLVINSNTDYNYYPNELIHTENGASVSGLTLLNNSVGDLALGNLLKKVQLSVPEEAVCNINVETNDLSNPSIMRVGTRPDPYYFPQAGSSLIDAGKNVGLSYLGTLPDIGAFEYGSTQIPNKPPRLSISSPANRSKFNSEDMISVIVNATDSDGTIEKVEFFTGPTKLGEDSKAPYQYEIKASSTGSFTLTARAIDNKGAVSVSDTIRITKSGSKFK